MQSSCCACFILKSTSPNLKKGCYNIDIRCQICSLLTFLRCDMMVELQWSRQVDKELEWKGSEGYQWERLACKPLSVASTWLLVSPRWDWRPSQETVMQSLALSASPVGHQIRVSQHYQHYNSGTQSDAICNVTLQHSLMYSLYDTDMHHIVYAILMQSHASFNKR